MYRSIIFLLVLSRFGPFIENMICIPLGQMLMFRGHEKRECKQKTRTQIWYQIYKASSKNLHKHFIIYSMPRRPIKINQSRLIYLGPVETSTPCKQDSRISRTLPSISPIVDKGENMSDSMEVDQHHEGMSGNLECDISPDKRYLYNM